MATTKDQLERIANALDGGGNFGQGTVNEVGYLERIAKYIEENGTGGGGGGGGSSVYLIPSADSGITLDKTWKEIYDALQAGTPAYIYAPGAEYDPTNGGMAILTPILFATGAGGEDPNYSVTAVNPMFGGVMAYDASSPTDYPVMRDGNN